MKVSVLIPMFNSEKYIAETVESVLKQTYMDFEVILIDDASTDRTIEITKDLAETDQRIVLTSNIHSKGPSGARNTGLELAKGEYIALLDSDDLMLPNRLEKQVEFLDHNIQVGVLGTWIVEFGNSNNVVQEPTDSDDIKAKLSVCPSIANPSAMIRKSVLTQSNIKYRSEYDFAEDYDLWVRLMDVTNFANLPEVLTKYRIHGENISIASKTKMIAAWEKVEERLLKRLEIVPSEEVLLILDALELDDFSDKGKDWRDNAIALCKLIKNQNEIIGVFPKKALRTFVDMKISLLV